MSWTAPMTAVANTAFTAAQFNTHIRDNLNETAVAKATAANNLFVSTGANALAERVPSSHTVSTSQSTTSTSYTDLATTGPTFTVTTGTKALIWFAAAVQHNTTDIACFASVAVSGATTVAASDAWCIANPSRLTDSRLASLHMFTGLTAGSNTFTMKYRVPSGTGNFANREIVGIPL
jgi:hypothetical protein